MKERGNVSEIKVVFPQRQREKALGLPQDGMACDYSKVIMAVTCHYLLTEGTWEEVVTN